VNKSGPINAVRRTTSLPKRDAENAVNGIVHVVSTEVPVGRRVVVSGFGSVNPTHRGPRTGRDPRTGAPVPTASWGSVRVAPSGTFEEILNGKATIAVPKSSRPATGAASATTRPGTRSSQASTTTAPQRLAGSGSRKVVGRASAQEVGARPGENSSTDIGQTGRRACPGEDSNEATGQEGR